MISNIVMTFSVFLLLVITGNQDITLADGHLIKTPIIN